MIAFAARDEDEQMKVDSMRPSQVFRSRAHPKVSHGENLHIQPVGWRRAVASPLDFIGQVPQVPARHGSISTICAAIFTVLCVATVLIITISAALTTCSDTVTPEANKRVMHRFTEFINTASEKLAEELISPEAVFHVPGRPEPVRGPAGYREIIGMMREGFPDIQWTLEETVAEGDMVAARFTMRGTHRGIFFGVPPTGKTIKVQAMNFYRLSGGRFVEERGQPDLLSLLQQIGAVQAG
jgi:steroid delta-isomerase-like uncharacterized protein